jgi:3-oxo-5alpha-steroid 4-dehydrogenase
VIVDASAVRHWSATTDLAIVGYGIAGVCGAIEACTNGAAVLVLERASGASGATAVSSGHFYLGGGTAVQRACGFEDSPTGLASYLTAVTRRPNRAKGASTSSVQAVPNAPSIERKWVELN